MKEIIFILFFTLTGLMAEAQNYFGYPNPFDQSISFDFRIESGDSLAFRLLDLGGNIQSHLQKKAFYQSDKIVLTLDSLKNGVYLASVKVDTNRYNRKIVKTGNSNHVNIELNINVIPFSSDQLIIYPNPADAEVTLVLKTPTSRAKVFLHDLDGKKLFSEKFNTTTGIIRSNINISGLPDGIYLIHTETKYNRITQKIVKGS